MKRARHRSSDRHDDGSCRLRSVLASTPHATRAAPSRRSHRRAGISPLAVALAATRPRARQLAAARTAWAAAIAAALLSLAPAVARAVFTVTTTYEYNADGALTAVSRRAGDAAPTATYLTWDNFTPDAGDPTAGTVHPADGNLLGLGASPGLSGARLQFAYDQRDRLTACRAAGQPPVAYAYHPASLMASSTLASGDSLDFYYGDGDAAQVTNMRQSTSGTTASFLGPAYYLSDGSEQVLLLPRKDTAGVYEPTQQRMTPYAYAPYGAGAGEPNRSLAPPVDAYDLSRNPFRYAGEYRDAHCLIDYLRWRWYLAGLETFLSRDPADGMHRYGYAGGNPITRVDPTGLRWQSTYERGVRGFLHALGAGATALSVLPGIGQAMFALQLTAESGTYFHSWSNLAMLGFGAAAAASEGLELGRDALPLERAIRPARAFGSRLGLDALIGGGQSVIAGYGGRPHQRFDWSALEENVGTTAAAMLVGRIGAGLGYRPFNLSASQVDEMWQAHAADESQMNKTMVFRYRERSAYSRVMWTTPWMERYHVGLYHEGVVAIGDENITVSHLGNQNVGGRMVFGWKTATQRLSQEMPPSRFLTAGAGRRQLALVAVRDSNLVQSTMEEMNPRGYPTVADQERSIRSAGRPQRGPYNATTNNCQHHAYGVWSSLSGNNPGVLSVPE